MRKGGVEPIVVGRAEDNSPSNGNGSGGTEADHFKEFGVSSVPHSAVAAANTSATTNDSLESTGSIDELGNPSGQT